MVCRVGDLLAVRLLVLEETPRPIALVDTALLDDGGSKNVSAVLTCAPEKGVLSESCCGDAKG